MRKLSFFLLLALLLEFVLSGCSINREITKRAFYSPKRKARTATSRGSFKKSPYKITDSALKDMKFEDEISNDKAVIKYQKGLSQQSKMALSELTQTIIQVEHQTGLEIIIKPKAYLIRVEQIPQSFEFTITNEPNQFCFPMFVEARNEDYEDILTANTIYPCTVLHEITEMSISAPWSPRSVFGDLHWRWFIFEWHIKHNTRWFRDGFANYTGLLACRIAKLKRPNSAPYYGHQHPFSALSRVGKKLFTWDQSYKGKDTGDYYDAALGLFLVIEKRFGKEKIKEIIQSIKTLDFPDGRALINLCNQKLQTDIEELADNFDFPVFGLKTDQLTITTALNDDLAVQTGLLVNYVEENSPAAVAGIKEADVIVEVNSQAVQNCLDLEIAFFDSLTSPNIDITIFRKNEDYKKLNLQNR